MIDDKYLTRNITLYDLTKTSHSQFQDKNRELDDSQISKLREGAGLLEHVIYVIGPIQVTSGYRCPDLNKFIGSSDKSQHLLCEAYDFVPSKIATDVAFRLLWKDIVNGGTNVGQLIHENDGVKEWIHISLGRPYRPEEKCKQILRMTKVKGETHYERLA